MHTNFLPDSAGIFGAPEIKLYNCRKCGQKTATCCMWESTCGGYEDYKYECQNATCRYSWWVDGIDS